MIKKSKRNVYTPILDGNATCKSSTIKFSNTRVFVLVTISLLVAAFFFYLPIIDYKLSNIDIFKNDLIQENGVINNYSDNNFCSVTSDEHKFDCFPRGKADQKSCEERNCCWVPSTQDSQIPWCYYPSNYSNYKVINVTKSRNEIIAYFNLTKYTNYKDDVKILCMDITLQTAKRLRIKVSNMK